MTLGPATEGSSDPKSTTKRSDDPDQRSVDMRNQIQSFIETNINDRKLTLVEAISIILPFTNLDTNKRMAASLQKPEKEPAKEGSGSNKGPSGKQPRADKPWKVSARDRGDDAK